ncbi:acyl-CoA dehydratase activase-related protein [Serpentinicella alkaliphila]|uniref:Putative nucleotide-binding protein (Sugar kinase/HSP70/actin superfamily) n=1 Tax=Serpentinicella alkaliphila TaxID=1734049 RepID=A0A4R2TLX7_9FIRM|nr:2-hydroxyacyl-CoA dehydratase [Serpentinicella alkaliphila]QUH24554.1 2-hydroxyacyl-CoA dehydratase [Serpentinicella alkaliphila]TCQ04648.1 putative nucleotide-binding protein (sugar kinase/HSP70/actin superfamily) [Serpentinicella alkaliphila]
MKVSFPYMGTTVIYKKLLEQLGHDVIMPPIPSQKTINLGVKYSPEFACFPLKVIMGSYMEAIEKGAEVIITSGGHGPCRAGFYEQVHSRILKQEGHNVEFIVFNSMFRDFKNFYKNLMRIKADNSWIKVAKSLMLVYDMMKKLDVLEKEVQVIRAYEIKKGETTRIWENIQRIFDQANNKKQIREAFEKGKELLSKVRKHDVKPQNRLRVGIVGEIYVVMEPSINMKMEELLGSLGVEVERSQYLSQWVDYNVLPDFMNYTHEKEVLKKGEKYLPIEIGGHAKQTLGQIVDFSKRGFDGVVHLMPFGCLPELVSQSIIPRITEDLGIPVLTLSIDEQTGVANNLTRVEAFLDLIRGKHSKKIS